MSDTILTKLAKARLTESVDPKFVELFTLAHKLGISHVEVEFHGSGDSGDTNGVNLYKNGKEFNPRMPDPSSEETYSPYIDNPDWTPEHKTLGDLAESYFHEAQDKHVDWDWYNNDGGGGTMNIDLTSGEVSFTGYVYETVTYDQEGTSFNAFGLDEEEVR